MTESLEAFARRFWDVTREDPDRYWEHRWAEELCLKLGLNLQDLSA